ncbi:MAG: EthD domain-containing protein [Chloroflexi bacterium]|nr:EthD domain-containing protein [Chloroflexota bacterium]
MIKSVTLIKRKAGLSREAFMRYYEEVHAPLGLRHFPTFRRYVRNYPITPPGGLAPDFDCIMEVWFDDMEGAKAVTDALGGYRTEVGRIFLEDEERFMDRASRVSFLVDERVSK